MLVTTSYHADESMKKQAVLLAKKFGVRYIARGQSSIPRLRRKYGQEDFLIVGETGLRFAPVQADEYFFHPSMALIRIKRLLAGESDTLLELAGIRPGDRVLDCTAGLASDSVVFAYAVGSRGHVTALESERMPAFIVEEGLQTYESGVPEVDSAMRRVELVNVEHTDYLSRLPDASFDIVYFDPMFRRPVEAASSISPLRDVANPEAVSGQAVVEARRVARRMVVLKEHRDSREFERLGFRKIGRGHTKVAYGVIEC